MRDAPETIDQPRARTFRLGRGATAALLFLIFNLSYILCPYWRAPVPPAWQWVTLVVTASMGLAWAMLSSAEHRFSWTPRGVLSVLLIGALVLIPNARALLVGVPWRGDESFHMSRSIWLLRGVLGKLLIPLGITLLVTAAACVLP